MNVEEGKMSLRNPSCGDADGEENVIITKRRKLVDEDCVGLSSSSNFDSSCSSSDVAGIANCVADENQVATKNCDAVVLNNASSVLTNVLALV
uniref:Uncharacterized protein n=1 Tax=Romanomermis culicivorax TaxID=13658 RepID=A0A915J8S8_ROMCU